MSAISPTPGATFIVDTATVTGCTAVTAANAAPIVLLHLEGAWNSGAADVLDVILPAGNLSDGAAGIGLEIVASAHATHEHTEAV